jgi:hypothetical protein
MQYALLVYETAEAFAARTGKDKEAMWGSWMAYTEALRNAGVTIGGSGLEPPATGTTLRCHDGERTVQDGPYADTKEQLGGFYIIDVPDLDTALEWAARCPAASYGSVELRPVLGSFTAPANGSVAAQSTLST